MCPACMASAAVIAGSVVSTGGITAMVVKVLRVKEKRQARVSTYRTEGRNEDGYSDKHGTGDDRTAS